MGLQPLQPVSLRFPEAETPQLRIESWSNAARLLHIRGFARDGIISFEHTTNSDRSRKAETFDLSDWPIVLEVYPDTAPVRRGECYVRLSLLAAGALVHVLSAGYITDSKTVAWPPGVFESFTEGPGLIRIITGTDPAAGTEISQSVPTNARWRLIALRIVLATDATVATRRIQLLFDDGATTVLRLVSPLTQAENTTRYYMWYIGAPRDTSFYNNRGLFPLPDELYLPQLYRFRTVTVNQQAGDNYQAPVFMVEEWIEE